MQFKPTATGTVCRSLFFIALMIGFGACGPNYIYDQSLPLKDHQWTYADSTDFKVPIVDTNKVYNIFLDITHDKSYPYQNLYLMVHTTFPSGKRLDQRLSIDLLSKTGLWQGQCSGEQCDLRVRMQEGAYFNETGDYRFVLEQFMRKDSIPGLHALALRIEDTGIDRRNSTAE
ncbi:MAG: gliding motility lipoprotein GldH [Bacteroidota bacterium]